MCFHFGLKKKSSLTGAFWGTFFWPFLAILRPPTMMKRKARKPQVDSGTLPAKAVIKDMLATRPMAVVTRITAYLGPAAA